MKGFHWMNRCDNGRLRDQIVYSSSRVIFNRLCANVVKQTVYCKVTSHGIFVRCPKGISNNRYPGIRMIGFLCPQMREVHMESKEFHSGCFQVFRLRGVGRYNANFVLVWMIHIIVVVLFQIIPHHMRKLHPRGFVQCHINIVRCSIQ